MNEPKMSPAQSMMELVMEYAPIRAVYVAAKLGVADLIKNEGSSAQYLADELQVHPGALYRILRTLAGFGILHQDESNNFSLTPLGETLRGDSEQSVRDYVIFNHESAYFSFNELLQSVRTGEPAFDKVFGKPLFEYLAENPQFNSVFRAGLSSRTRIETPALLEAYDFSEIRQVVDVGGANGSFLSLILTTHDHVAGLLLDREAAIEAARSGGGGPLPRCDFVVGDFFRAVPPGGDVYILKLVIHDWSDEQSIQILQNCRAAMADDSRLLIIEGLIGEPNELTFSHLMDLTMLVQGAGQERTEEEYVALLQQSGLRLNRTIPTKSHLSILEAIRD